MKDRAGRRISRSSSRRNAIAAVLTAIAMLALPARGGSGVSAVPGPDQLAQALETLISGQHDLQGATIGVAVADAAGGNPIFEHNAWEPLTPASNLKLLTTGAAVLALGADHTFETRVLLDGQELVIVGSGDPGLGDPKLLNEADPPLLIDDLLTRVASAVAERGIAEIDGIVVDDRVFDRDFVHENWPEDQLNRWYCAEVAGINIYNNVLTFFFEAGARAGEPANTSVQPSLGRFADGWVTVANRTKTVGKGSNTVWIARPSPQNRFTLFGDHRAGTRVSVDVSIHEPPMVTGYLLASALADAGVRVATGGPQRTPAVRYPTRGERFDDATPLVVVHTSMADVLTRANRDSQNLFTEALIKAIGHEVTGEPGSWANGSAVIRMMVAERLGPEHASPMRIDDGSGMSRENRIAPATLALWMRGVLRDADQRAAMLGSMPMPGEGTLRNRFKNARPANRVYAKSGTISKVRCLSGCVIAADDPRRAVTFSVLVNGIEGGRAVRAAKALHESVVMEIDRWIAAGGGAPAPLPTNRPAEPVPQFGG